MLTVALPCPLWPLLYDAHCGFAKPTVAATLPCPLWLCYAHGGFAMPTVALLCSLWLCYAHCLCEHTTCASELQTGALHSLLATLATYCVLCVLCVLLCSLCVLPCLLCVPTCASRMARVLASCRSCAVSWPPWPWPAAASGQNCSSSGRTASGRPRRT